MPLSSASLLCTTPPSPDPAFSSAKRSSKQMAQGSLGQPARAQAWPGPSVLLCLSCCCQPHMHIFSHISILENASSEQGPSCSAMDADHPILTFWSLELHLCTGRWEIPPCRVAPICTSTADLEAVLTPPPHHSHGFCRDSSRGQEACLPKVPLWSKP